MTDIIELIDNALDDYTSPDAMRWTPEAPDAALSAGERLARERADLVAFRPGQGFHNPPGLALDFMVPERAGHERLRDWLLAHAGQMSISEVIWNRRTYRPTPSETPAPAMTLDYVADLFEVPRGLLGWGLVDEINMFGNAYVKVPERRTRAMHMAYSVRLRARRKRRRS